MTLWMKGKKNFSVFFLKKLSLRSQRQRNFDLKTILVVIGSMWLNNNEELRKQSQSFHLVNREWHKLFLLLQFTENNDWDRIS
jgi:hypothetical protein